MRFIKFLFSKKKGKNIPNRIYLSNYPQNDRAERQKIYENQREYILKGKVTNSKNYDKSLLSLSSAFLGATITFIGNVIPLKAASYLWSIEISWGMFVLAIIFTLVSFQISQMALDFQLKLAEYYYICFRGGAFGIKNKYDICNKILGYLSGLSFVFGVGMLALFIILNISVEAKMAVKLNKVITTDTSKGIPAGPLQPISHSGTRGIPTAALQQVNGPASVSNSDKTDGIPAPTLVPVPTSNPSSEGSGNNSGGSSSGKNSNSGKSGGK